MEVITENMRSEIHWTNESSPKVYQAIQDDNLQEIKSFFKDETLINVPLQATGPLAGYTVLHIACMNQNKELVKLLVDYYHADFNIVADDGSQPIHLACLFGNGHQFLSVEILLRAGANVDAELGQELFLKYVKDKVWYDDFGDKMTLLTFAVLYKYSNIFVYDLIYGKANLKLRSLKNKTLLMYAIEDSPITTILVLISRIQDSEFINARDNDGFPATHYVLHRNGFKNYKYSDDEEQQINIIIMKYLINAGADVTLTINGDPDTLLLNMAAYTYSAEMLPRLLTHYDDISKSKALRYATRPLEDPKTELNNDLKKLSTEVILQDLVYRRTLGLPVPEDEKKLMDELIANDATIREKIECYSTEAQNFIDETLKKNVLNYGDDSITHYDFVSSCLNDKKCHLLVRNKSLIDVFDKSFPDYFYLRRLISKRIERVLERVELLDALTRVENLCQAVPLPYELVLIIVEDLNNQDLETFIDAFNL